MRRVSCRRISENSAGTDLSLSSINPDKDAKTPLSGFTLLLFFFISTYPIYIEGRLHGFIKTRYQVNAFIYAYSAAVQTQLIIIGHSPADTCIKLIICPPFFVLVM